MTDTPTTAADLRVRARGITKSFDENHVLRGVDLEVPTGTTTALLGPSGSGKTTVLRTLNVLERADAGLIAVGDVEIDFDTLPASGRVARERVAELRAQSAMVFQQHHLFPHRTVLGNVIEGPVQVQKRPQDEAVADARRLLEQVGLSEKADQYPGQLSGGQQQRVGIARALALKPKVVLFDEPTSSLDPELVGEVLAVIKDLADQGWTMMIVTHEIQFARQVADQVLFLDDGVVLEHGTPDQVIGDPREERTRRFLSRILRD